MVRRRRILWNRARVREGIWRILPAPQFGQDLPFPVAQTDGASLKLEFATPAELFAEGPFTVAETGPH